MPTITITLRSLVAFAAGIAIAAVSVVVFQAWQVDAAPGDTDTTFVPITPCRLFDTRPAPQRVGSFGSFGAAETKTIAAHGTNGDCTIPTDAVGLSTNVTAVGATANTFLTFWGSGAQPTAANLNPRAGGPVTPNAVNTPLSATGTFNVFNKAGSVDVIVDVNGYYTKASLAELASRVTSVEAKLAALEAAQPFALTATSGGASLTSSPTAYVTVPLNAPVDGQVTLNSTAIVEHSQQFSDVVCAIGTSTSLPPLTTFSESDHWFDAPDGGAGAGISGTRTFDIAAGATVDYVLACKEFGDGGQIRVANLTAIFTPAA